MKKDLVKDIFFYLPSRIIPALVAFLTVPILTRMFLPDVIGKYFLIQTSVTLISTLSVGWLVTTYIRFYPADQDKNAFHHLINLFLVFSALGAVAFILIELWQNGVSNYFFLGAGLLWLIATNAFDFFSGTMRAKRNVGLFSLLTSARVILGTALGFVAIIFFKGGPEYLLIGLSLGVFLILPTMVQLSDLKLKLHRDSWPTYTSLLEFGFPLAVVGFSVSLLSYGDRYILNFFSGSQAVGIYSANYDIAEKTIFLIVTLFHRSSTPIAFNIWEKESEQKVVEFIRQTLRIYILSCLPLAMFMTIFSDKIGAFILPQNYHSGYAVLPWVSFGSFFVGIMHRYYTVLNCKKRNDLAMKVCVQSVVINIVINILLIPKMGLAGAAVATFISYVMFALLTFRESEKVLPVGFLTGLFTKVLMACTFIGITLKFLLGTIFQNNIYFCITSGLLFFSSYGVFLFNSTEIQTEEKQYFKKFLPASLKK